MDNNNEFVQISLKRYTELIETSKQFKKFQNKTKIPIKLYEPTISDLFNYNTHNCPYIFVKPNQLQKNLIKYINKLNDVLVEKDNQIVNLTKENDRLNKCLDKPLIKKKRFRLFKKIS